MTDEKNKFQALADEFKEKYLETEQSRKHLRSSDKERKEVNEIFRGIKEKGEKGEDITEEVLRRLLPHSDTKYRREKG